MTKPNTAHIAVILDRSGSMHVMADEARGGFRALVEDQRSQPYDARMSVTFFDHEYDLVADGVPLATLDDKAIAEAYEPRGMTALLDAIGRTIFDLGQKLARMDERERPAKVVVAIITDGYENASKRYTLERVREMIERQERDYNWSFVFQAGDLDAFHMAKHGLGIGQTMSYDSTQAGATRSAYGAVGQSVTVAVTGDDE